MSIDPATIYSALYSRAASDSAGSALRAMLGTFPNPFSTDSAFAGQRAVFPADRLALFAKAQVPLPWLVWRAGSIAGPSGDMRDLSAAWWVYVAPSAGDYATHTIAAAVDALYGHDRAHSISGGRLGVTFIGQPRLDTSLGASGLEIRISFLQRG